MQKLDHLGWVDGMSFVAHGLRIGLRVNDPQVLERVGACLPPGWRMARTPSVDLLYSLVIGGRAKSPGVRNFNLLYAGSARLARSLDLEEVLDSLHSAIELDVATLAPRRAFLHAGVVGWKNRAIIIPGRSGTGKTSLVAAFVRAGATYYSDEYAPVDADGRVHPFPTPLKFRDPSMERGKRECSPASLGASVGLSRLRAGLVLVTWYEEGVRWRPRALGGGEAMIALLDNAMSLRLRPQVVLPAVGALVSDATALRGRRGDAEEVVEHVLSSIGSRWGSEIRGAAGRRVSVESAG